MQQYRFFHAFGTEIVVVFQKRSASQEKNTFGQGKWETDEYDSAPWTNFCQYGEFSL